MFFCPFRGDVRLTKSPFNQESTVVDIGRTTIWGLAHTNVLPTQGTYTVGKVPGTGKDSLTTPLPSLES